MFTQGPISIISLEHVNSQSTVKMLHTTRKKYQPITFSLIVTNYKFFLKTKSLNLSKWDLRTRREIYTNFNFNCSVLVWPWRNVNITKTGIGRYYISSVSSTAMQNFKPDSICTLVRIIPHLRFLPRPNSQLKHYTTTQSKLYGTIGDLRRTALLIAATGLPVSSPVNTLFLTLIIAYTFFTRE